jgi:hypothetical protein
MKRKILLIGLVVTGYGLAVGQEPFNKKTLLQSPQKVVFSSQAGLGVTKVDRSPGIVLNYAIGAVIQHKLFVGIGGEKMINSMFVRDSKYVPVKDEVSYWKMNYQGVKLDYQFNVERAVSFTLGTIIGGGSVKRDFVCNSLDNNSLEYPLFNQRLKNVGYYYVFQPMVGMNMDVTDKISFRVNASYRFISLGNESNTVGMSAAKFNGPSASFTVQFEAFK